jgi:hypothetical protein
MALTLSQLATNTAQVTFSYAGNMLTLIYYPDRVTEKALATLQSFSKMDENSVVAGFQAFNETLANIIKSWDVFEDDAETKMFPLEPERLAELPIAFRMECINAIMGDIRPESITSQA